MKTYGEITYSNNQWRITCAPHVAMRMKDMFRSIDKGSYGGIYVSNTPQNAKDLQWFMMRYPLASTPEDLLLLNQTIEKFDTKQLKLNSIFTPEYVLKPVQSMALPLRDYQLQVVEMFSASGAGLCGDDLGLGKSPTAIGLLCANADSLPAMVVCQAHLPKQWENYFTKFAPHLKVHIVKKRGMYDLPPADIYIMTYSKIIGWGDLLMQGYFKAAVYDEVQELRRTDTAKYKAATLLTAHSNYVIGLSATPIYNYGGEIYAVMNIIKPGCLGRMEEFSREWCTGDGGYSQYDPSGRLVVKNPEALGAYLRENHLMIRRTREEVGRQLPPVEKVTQTVEYDKEIAEKYMAELKEVASRALYSTNFFEKGQAAARLDNLARQMTGIAKARSAAEHIAGLCESGQKIIVCAWHREVWDILAHHLEKFKPALYTGHEGPSKKLKSVESFINGDSQLLFISLRSGAGLDGLQEASKTIVHVEFDWSPAVDEQLNGRLRRDGMDHSSSVLAVYMYSNEGTDPLMLDARGIKASQAQGIVNPGQSVASTAVDPERLRKLAEKILSK